MVYENITLGTFLARPNRFIAHVEVNGITELCHVKNTSRLTELLVPGVPAAVQKAGDPARKTPYSLIAVQHEGRWVNIDSQAPNKVFGEWLKTERPFGEATLLKPETTWGHSRFDWYVETPARKIFIEVKGVTLVEEGIARFPGAPTTRGVKHLNELAACRAQGYEACIAFVAKRGEVTHCAPNDSLDPAFGQALRSASAAGVQLLALGCAVTADTLVIDRQLGLLL